MSRRKFQYKKRSFDTARKRTEQSSGTRDNYILEDIPLYKPTEGENLLRILPPTWKEPTHYGYDIYVHYNVGPDSAAYLCLEKMKEQPCPICEARSLADHEGDKEYAKKLKPTKRVLFYLVDRDKEKEGLKAWASPWTVDKEVMIQATDSRTREFFPVDDPDDGFDVKITRTGIGEQTKYSVTIARRPSSIDLDDSTWDTLENHPVPEVLVYYDYDHINQIFEGKAPESSDSQKDNNDPLPDLDITYDEVQALNGGALDALCDEAKLKLDPGSFDTDQDLADAICDELGLQKPKVTRGRRKTEPEPEADREPEPEPDREPEPEPDREPEPEPEKKESSVRNRLAGLRKRHQQED